MRKYLALLLLLTAPCFSEDNIDCEKAFTTIEVNLCARREADRADENLEKYLVKAREQYASEVRVVEALESSQELWLTYRKAHCDAINERWSGGTIRNTMYHGCMLKLTKLRTHLIWEDYLTSMDSTPALLPEPTL
jgi:uncharacterized protein YecT (DUF1311 family)